MKSVDLARNLIIGAALCAAVAAPALAGASGLQQPAAQPSAANSKDLADTWQGTLHAGKDLRTVIKISKADTGGYKAVFYSIDQGAQPLNIDSITQDGSTVKFTLKLIGGTFEGKLSGDGKTIDGTWSQGPNPLPLVLTRATPETEWTIPEPPKPVPPMAANADPSLEVATIEPSDPNRQGKGFTLRGTHIMTLNTNLNDLIALAYGLHAKQIVGAPDWAFSSLYDIDGVPDAPGRPSVKQMGIMMQKLLADRFQLKFHHEQRELSVYAVSVAGGGPKMSKSDGGPNDLPAFFFRGFGDLVARNLDMTEFATWMQSSVMDKPVIDRTGLKDKYNFELKWTPDDSQFAQFRGAVAAQPPPNTDPNAPPSLYTAITEQLGLKLESTKAPDDVIVIDHVEKPSAN